MIVQLRTADTSLPRLPPPPKSWSTVQNLAHFLDSSSWVFWSQSRPGSSLDLSWIQFHPSQLSTLPSGSPSSLSSPLSIWSPHWAPGSSRLISREEICSRSTLLRCMSFAEHWFFCDLYETSLKAQRVRVSYAPQYTYCP